MKKKPLSGVHYLNRAGLTLDDATTYELYYWRFEEGIDDQDRISVFVWDYPEYYLITYDEYWGMYSVDVLVRKSDLRMWGLGVKKAGDEIKRFIADMRNGRNVG